MHVNQRWCHWEGAHLHVGTVFTLNGPRLSCPGANEAAFHTQGHLQVRVALCTRLTHCLQQHRSGLAHGLKGRSEFHVLVITSPSHANTDYFIQLICATSSCGLHIILS